MGEGAREQYNDMKVMDERSVITNDAAAFLCLLLFLFLADEIFIVRQSTFAIYTLSI